VKFQELRRTTANAEVRSSYAAGNLTINLTSRFSNNVTLEDAMFEIILHRLRSQEKSEGRQDDSGLSDENVI